MISAFVESPARQECNLAVLPVSGTERELTATRRAHCSLAPFLGYREDDTVFVDIQP